MTQVPRIVAAAIAAMIIAAGPAWSATVRKDIELETTMSHNPTFQIYRYDLPLFDTSLGSLQKVELFWTADVSVNLKWTTTTHPLLDVEGHWRPNTEIPVVTYPGSGLNLTIFPTEAISVGLAHSGPSGELSGSTTESGYAVNDALTQDLSPYWTSDRVELIYAEQFNALAEAGGGMDLVLTTLAKHKFSYVYTYAPNIPEPATWVIMIGGLGAAGVALRRRGALVA